jgi:hypothetical protein
MDALPESDPAAHNIAQRNDSQSNTALPNDGESIQNEAERFKTAMQIVKTIKKQYVDPRVDFYKTNTKTPRVLFRVSGVTTILFGATLPALAAGNLDNKNLALLGFTIAINKTVVVSILSIAIAVLTGVASFFRWESTWHGNSTTQVAIEQFCAKWELELLNAEACLAPETRIKHIYLATDDLLANVQAAISAETEGFFSNLRFPKSDQTSK